MDNINQKIMNFQSDNNYEFSTTPFSDGEF